jgi:hypothetical protein
VKLASSSRKFVTKEYSKKTAEMTQWYEKRSKNFAEDAEELRVCSNLESFFYNNTNSHPVAIMASSTGIARSSAAEKHKISTRGWAEQQNKLLHAHMVQDVVPQRLVEILPTF